MRSPGSLVTVDGSYGEGGGGIVRTALAMAALTQQSVKIAGVRSGTPYPGIDIEDLVIARALAQSCQAEMTGAEIGSDTLTFHPTARPKSLTGVLEFPPGTRKPNALVALSSLIPVLARSGGYSVISCEGETYGTNSLTFDYFSGVGTAAYRKMGLYALPDQVKAGFGRESAGLVSLDIEPSALSGVSWGTRGSLLSCRAVVTTAELPSAIGQRGSAHLELLGRQANVPIAVETSQVQSDRPGAFVTVWAQYERGVGGTTACGQKGVRMETLAQQAFDNLLTWMESDATVDPYVADLMLIPASIAEGETTFKTSRLTSRFLTSVWVVKQFLPIHITVRGKENSPGTVSIHRD